MEEAISSILITERAIRKRIRELGDAITEAYHDQPLTLVVLSNGAMIFGADLARAIRTPLHLDTLGVRSYEGTESTGTVSVYGDLKLVVTDRRVIVVDDILDTGRTLKAVTEHLLAAGARDVASCVLLSKQRQRAVAIEAEYAGFEIADQFVVGYGLDYDEHYRNLPYIGVLDDARLDKAPPAPNALLGVPWEEWQEEQVRVAAATIHNIGNAITVARLTIDEVRSESGVREALELLHDEIWPEIERRLGDGSLLDFLTSDEVGREYPEMVRSLLAHASSAYVRRRNSIVAVTTKLDHVASILEVHSRLTEAPAEPVAVSLDEVLADAQTLVRESCAKHEVDFVPHRNRGLMVLTDRTLLTDAVVNLFTNAIDAMRAADGLTHRAIQVKAGMDDGRVFCVVANTGPPIPVADRERIFDFGYSTKGDVGRGIGLHFCRRVIESHGGGLWYRAEPDGSPAFRIELTAVVGE